MEHLLQRVSVDDPLFHHGPGPHQRAAQALAHLRGTECSEFLRVQQRGRYSVGPTPSGGLPAISHDGQADAPEKTNFPVDASLIFYTLTSITAMDVHSIKTFLDQRLTTKREVERAARAVNVSVATMYRYKATPEAMTLSTLMKLKDSLGLPIENGAAWSKSGIVEAETRRLQLERGLAENQGARYTTVSPYSVNLELDEVTRLLLASDYGTDAPRISDVILNIRKERKALYSAHSYTTWEIWNGYGYLDFFNGVGRFSILPQALRSEQIQHFIANSQTPHTHRFFYLRHCPELPMFGIYAPVGVTLVRVDDIHLEYQSPTLTESFASTFNSYISQCSTKTPAQFLSFLQNPRTITI